MTSNEFTDLRAFLPDSSGRKSSREGSPTKTDSHCGKSEDFPPPCAICSLAQYSSWRPVNKTSRAMKIRSIPVMVQNQKDGLPKIVMEKRLVHRQCYLNLLSATGFDVDP